MTATSRSTSEYLRKLYYGFEEPEGYSSLSALWRRVQSDKKAGVAPSDLNFAGLRRWLHEQNTYSRHYPRKKRFKRNRVVAYAIDECWQGDLIDLSKIKRDNRGVTFLLCCTDVLSKYAFVEPLKSKTGIETAAALERIFKLGRVPDKFVCDAGKEFLNSAVRQLFKEYDVRLIVTQSDVKASAVERFNRTLKEKIFKMFTAAQTSNYIDYLPAIVKAYNMSYHRGIKMKPANVTDTNFKRAFRNLYGSKWPDLPRHKAVYKFDVGDEVRVTMNKPVFEKGYIGTYTREIFTVVRRLPRYPVVYKLQDENGEDIDGIFYESELVQVYPQ